MRKLTPRISIFWKLSSRLIGLCNFYFAKFLIIWQINYSNGRVYSRSNTLIKFIIIYYQEPITWAPVIIMFLVELIASSFFYLISKQARRVCGCKRVLVYNNFVGSTVFFTKLGLKVQNIEPINLAYILTPKCQNVTS